MTVYTSKDPKLNREILPSRNDADSQKRKFVDLVRQTTFRWPNLDPGMEIKVGDFGSVDEETGAFERCGNVYTDEETCHITQGFPETLGAIEERLCYSSSSVRTSQISVGPIVSLPGIMTAGLTFNFSFTGNNQSALLFMAEPQLHSMPNQLVQELMKKFHQSRFRDYALVTDVYACPAFYQYLSTGGAHNIELSVNAEVPVLAVSGGGQVGISGGSARSTAHERIGNYDATRQHRFFPLFSLKCVQRIWRRPTFSLSSPSWPVPSCALKDQALAQYPPIVEFPRSDYKHDDDFSAESWKDVHVPWDMLDDDGIGLRTRGRNNAEVHVITERSIFRVPIKPGDKVANLRERMLVEKAVMLERNTESQIEGYRLFPGMVIESIAPESSIYRPYR